jgi:hypothetical protein
MRDTKITITCGFVEKLASVLFLCKRDIEPSRRQNMIPLDTRARPIKSSILVQLEKTTLKRDDICQQDSYICGEIDRSIAYIEGSYCFETGSRFIMSSEVQVFIESISAWTFVEGP